MTVVSRFSCVGLTRGKRYDVIKRRGNLIQIVLDNGKIAFRSLSAFKIEKE